MSHGFSISELSCGYQGSGLICCPQASEQNVLSSTGKMVDGQRCGVSQVQGEGYNGIGAYPWVTRVGFRSMKFKKFKYGLVNH